MDSAIRGRTRELTRKVEATVPMNIHNRFDVEVIDAQTGKIKQRAQAENIICSQLWTRLFAPDTYFNYIHYGTGSGTPASTDTRLFTFLGCGSPSTSDDVSSLDYANCVYSFRRKIQLSETTAVGSTLTEIGIGYGTSAATLCTHAMLKDANGNQISIAKSNTDIINIYATIFVHWPADLFTGKIKLLAYTQNGLLTFARGMGGASSSVSARFQASTRANSSAYASATSTVTTNAPQKTLTFTFSRLSASDGNISGGIGGILCVYNSVSNPFLVLASGSGWFSGSNITGEAIGTGDGAKRDFATAFDCPSSAKIYIDGVENANVTVDNAPLSFDNMGKYFERIIVANGNAYPYPDAGSYAYADGACMPNAIYFNPYYAFGIKTVNVSGISFSDDLQTWNTATGGSVPEAYQYCKYIKTPSTYYPSNFVASTLTGKNIHFTTAPASGAVITADYHTPVIAKDTNHVFDLTITIQLGEYTA